MQTRETFGRQIMVARKLKGLTQLELAERAGITPGNMSRIEAGKYSTGLDLLLKIAEALEMELKLI